MTFPRLRRLAEPQDLAWCLAHSVGSTLPGTWLAHSHLPGLSRRLWAEEGGGEGPLSRVCQGRGRPPRWAPPRGPHWRTPAITCLDPAAPQKLDHVLGETRAQSGPKHAHVPCGPGAARPEDIRGALSGPSAGGGREAGARREGGGRRRRRGGCGACGDAGTQSPPARTAPQLPASRLQGPACSATCWPWAGFASRAIGAETARPDLPPCARMRLCLLPDLASLQASQVQPSILNTGPERSIGRTIPTLRDVPVSEGRQERGNQINQIITDRLMGAKKQLSTERASASLFSK